LPPCDGSFQDCVTENGDVCLAGASTHECELEEEEPVETIPFLEADEGQPEDVDKPNPYCDVVPDDYTGSCHDRKDYDQDTYLYPCNDGTEKVRWQDCPDATDLNYRNVDPESELPPACADFGIQGQMGSAECPPPPEDLPPCFSDESAASASAICQAPPDKPGDNYQPRLPNEEDLNCSDVDGTVKVIGQDPYGLDGDGDGTGCEANEVNGDVKDKNKNKVIRKTTVINSATATASATTTSPSAEVSSCRLDGSADGILQKFDLAKYQACGLYIESQKAYSDGFVAGCSQVGNTQLICQSFVDSSILNLKTQPAQTTTQRLPIKEATQPTQQGIQPAAVD
ncbi:MAG: hypothetical protein ACRD8W_26355, partial [Nitrososphaeraceae archaeon]